MKTLFQEITEDILKKYWGTSDIPDIHDIKPYDDVAKEKLNQLTEEEKKSCYFDYRTPASSRGITYDNPIRYCMDSDKITEGLIQTYPYKKTIENIKNYFSLNTSQIEAHIDKKNGQIKDIEILIPAIEDNIDKMKEAMDYCGYFLSSPKDTETIKKQWVTLSFEPKFQEDITIDLRNQIRYLYHWTPTKHLKKIMKNRLCPRTTNTFLNYPERIYLIATNDMEEIQKKGMTLFSKEKDKENCANNKFDYIQDGVRYMLYSLLKIDLVNLSHKIKFYADYNYSDCVYTENSIMPSSIENYETTQFSAKIN